MGKPLSELMRAVAVPSRQAESPSSDLATGARAPGTYLRSNGTAMRIEDMNPHHRAAAAAKARAAGDVALADELERGEDA